MNFTTVHHSRTLLTWTLARVIEGDWKPGLTEKLTLGAALDQLENGREWKQVSSASWQLSDQSDEYDVLFDQPDRVSSWR